MEKNRDFLQSKEWREFQEKAGSRVFCVENEGFSASIIEHELPVVGNYFYIPRGPVCSTVNSQQSKEGIRKVIELVEKEKVGWIRVDLKDKNDLNLIKENIKQKIVKAPHDMQPKEIFVLDIAKNEEDLLSEMSQKTRYNIKLAQKRGVKVFAITNNQDTRYKQSASWRTNSNDKISKKYVDKFIELINLTAKRKGISFHAEDYYRKMFESLPENMLKLYIAEYNRPASTREDDHSSTRGGKVIAANLVVFYNETATYLHGATDDEYRNVMAPHILQWQAILDAKKVGYKKYDFGGISTNCKLKTNNWSGITKFKLGFSPSTKPIEFLGSYDIIVIQWRYVLYRILQYIKEFILKTRK